MTFPRDAVLHSAEILTLRHCAPTMYHKITRLYTAYLRGIDRLPRNRIVDKGYLVDELDSNRVTALAVTHNPHLQLVGLSTGGLIECPDALLVCTDLEFVNAKWRSDQQPGSLLRVFLRQACLRYATNHRLIYDLAPQQRHRPRVVWRSPCGTTMVNYRLQGVQLVRE